jgi:hypothetical protein
MRAMGTELFESTEYIAIEAKRAPWADHLKKDEGVMLEFCEHAKMFKDNGWACHSNEYCDDWKCVLKEDSN